MRAAIKPKQIVVLPTFCPVAATKIAFLVMRKNVYFSFFRIDSITNLKSDTTFPIKSLKEWFLDFKRSLPWRENPTPYRVWVSEMMLQQTQVSVVLPYFEKWMAIFPTIHALADAPLERVLKVWEGLGYYSRARYLHEGAKYLVQHCGGDLPSQSEELAKIKGIGPYTRGAILAFAFRKKASAVDGNVIRVLSRFLREESEKKIRIYAEEILPEHEPWILSEGLIELGATLCIKEPQCSQCPLRTECAAFRNNEQHLFPKKTSRPQTTFLKREVAVICSQKGYLVQKTERGKVMADLYEFPYMEKGSKNIEREFEDLLGLDLRYLHALPEQKHTFTRYKVFLFPHLFEAQTSNQYVWRGKEELKRLPFSSGHKRILQLL